MNRYKKLLSNSGIFLVANFGSKILSFLLIRFYTAVLTTEEYGTVDVINTTAGLAYPIVTLCIIEAVLRFSIDDIDNRKNTFSSGLSIVILGNFLFLLIMPLLRLIDIFEANYIMIYLVTITSSFYMLAAHFVRGVGKSKLFAASGLIHTAVHIGLNLLFLLVFSWGMEGYLLSTIITNCFVTLVLFIVGKLDTFISFSINYKHTLDMLKYAIPLIPNSVFWWIMQSADRYTIHYIMTASDNGLYSAASKIPTIIATISGIFFHAWQISSVDEAKSKDKDVFYTNVFIGAGMMITISTTMIITFIQPIFHILVDKSFYEGWHAVPLLLIGTVFSSYSSFLGTNYVVMKKTKGVFITTVIGAASNVILNIMLTPIIGLYGTALATSVSFLLTWGVRSFDTRKFVKIHYSVFSFFLPTVMLIIQALLMTVKFDNIWLHSSLSILIVMCYWRVLRKIGLLLANRITSNTNARSAN